MPDPVTIITTIGLGLKLIDQFRDLAIRFMGKKLEPPSETADQTTNKIEFRHAGKVFKEVKVSQMKMDQWDDVRYKALERRIKSNWDLFHELFSQLPELRMDRIKSELCEDFRQMVCIYERALGTRLPDHYQLFEVCGAA